MSIYTHIPYTYHIAWSKLDLHYYGVKYMTPLAAMNAMAKGQNKTLKQIIDRRMLKGGEETINKIVADLKNGIKYDMPVIEYANGGFKQDGYHRLLAAQRLGIKKVPIFIIKRLYDAGY